MCVSQYAWGLAIHSLGFFVFCFGNCSGEGRVQRLRGSDEQISFQEKEERKMEARKAEPLCCELELGGSCASLVDYTLLLLFCFWGHNTNNYDFSFFLMILLALSFVLKSISGC